MEGPHGELRPWLTNRLGGDHSDSLAVVYHVTPRQVTSVTHHANSAPGLTCQHGANLDSLQTGILDALDKILVNLLIGFYDDFPGKRILDIFQRDSPQHAVPKWLDDFSTLHQRRHFDSIQGAAVIFRNDRVLGDVHKTAGEVPGVRGLEGRVCQSFARPVSRDEVLQHGEPLPEIGCNGSFNDLSRGLGHQPAHAGKLADLLGTASGAGIRHHEDRVEAGDGNFTAIFVRDVFGPEITQHLISNPVRHLGPDIHYFVVTLPIRDQPVLVLLLDLANILVGLLEQLFLTHRDHHILDRNRYPCPCRIMKADILKLIGEDDSRLVTREPIADVDQVGEFLLFHHPINFLK